MRDLSRLSTILAAVALAACTAAEERGMKDAKNLQQISAEFWEDYLATHPQDATSLGDRRHDDRLRDISAAGRASWVRRLQGFRTRLGEISPGALSPDESVTLRSLMDVVDNGLARASCEFATWVVDPLRGPQVNLQNIVAIQTVSTPEQARDMVARWRAMGPYLDDFLANLREGKRAGKFAVGEAVKRTLGQLDDLLATPVDEWPLLNPLEEPHVDWTEDERKSFRDGLRDAVKSIILPAFERYRDFLREEILPEARPSDRPGLMHVTGGKEAYRKMIRVHTSLDISPEALHRIGRDEVAKINAETRALGKKVFGLDDRKEILKRLRSDPATHFSSRDEVEEKARDALRKAQDAMVDWFGILPKAPCVVERMADYEEEDSTIAYYRQPATDGSRPGTYWINTYRPETRPRYEAEALAFHEAIPGHHLQIAIAQELEGIPEFRKHEGFTAFVEGWALYSERLSNEMGLYTADLDRLGMLSYDSWRACRLVVDTGMHAMGWTRQQAIDFMLENSALAENNIINEVDRYITWPGQALAYKTGQLEILRLREEAKRRLGDRFDIKWFHDRVLENGAVSLTILREQIEEAIESR